MTEIRKITHYDLYRVHYGQKHIEFRVSPSHDWEVNPYGHTTWFSIPFHALPDEIQNLHIQNLALRDVETAVKQAARIYEPYDTLPSFWKGYEDYPAAMPAEYNGPDAQAYDRGQNLRLILQKILPPWEAQ